jgi:hypothetical protein
MNRAWLKDVGRRFLLELAIGVGILVTLSTVFCIGDLIIYGHVNW